MTLNEKLNYIYVENKAPEVHIDNITCMEDLLSIAAKYENYIIEQIEKANDGTIQGVLYPIKLINSNGSILGAFAQSSRGCKLVLVVKGVSISRKGKVSEVDVARVINTMYNFIKN